MNGASKCASGVLGWSLLEYFLHRELGHKLHTFLRDQHLEHHRYPEQSSSPKWAMIALALVVTGDPALIGLSAGYFAYEWCHYCAHHRDENRHSLHHGQPDGNYGVTSPLWDIVLSSRL